MRRCQKCLYTFYAGYMLIFKMFFVSVYVLIVLRCGPFYCLGGLYECLNGCVTYYVTIQQS
jgi:hypothetical protein